MFVWYDYLILFVVLLISTLTGFYYAKKSKTVQDYLTGNKRMKSLPTAISVVISHFTGIIFVGFPAGVYRYGAFFLLTIFSEFIIISVSVFVYYPAFFDNEVSSIFQYLEKRFDNKNKMLGLIMYIIFENVFLPLVIFPPALTLSHATGINVNLVAFIICIICVFYTAIGGLRTVIWTDLLQFIIVVISFIIICYVGISSLGFSFILEKAFEGERLDIFDFSLDPTKKDSFWIITIGLTVRILYYFSLTQSSAQKYLSLPTYKDCVRSLLISGIGFICIATSSVFFGLILYANYENCDPLLDGKISRNDEIVPFYLSQVSTQIYGISGLFTTAIVCAGISTLSSSLNALAGSIYNDILVTKLFRRELKEHTKLQIIKMIVAVQGLICFGLTFIIPHLGDIVPLVLGITGLIDGPTLGLITVGILFPKVTSNNAFYGTVGGVAFMACVYFPSMFFKYNQKVVFIPKPLSTNGCISHNSTDFKNSSLITVLNQDSQVFFLFRISYQYYCIIGALITMILTLILNLIYKRKPQQQNVEKELETFIPTSNK